MVKEHSSSKRIEEELLNGTAKSNGRFQIELYIDYQRQRLEKSCDDSTNNDGCLKDCRVARFDLQAVICMSILVIQDLQIGMGIWLRSHLCQGLSAASSSLGFRAVTSFWYIGYIARKQ